MEAVTARGETDPSPPAQSEQHKIGPRGGLSPSEGERETGALPIKGGYVAGQGGGDLLVGVGEKDDRQLVFWKSLDAGGKA